jgi:phosphatidylglycerol---prolipoprotein diacylglyceryl transferase
VVTSAVVGGLVGAHLLHFFGYHPELLKDGWGVVLRVWDGLSSMGGVLGALAGIFVYFYRHKIKVRPYADALALGTAPGWCLARIGCLMARDHPGVKTDFFLGWGPWEGRVGEVRHDLGFYDAIALGLITAALYLLARKPRPQGMLMGILACVYSVQRFFSDFLRAEDMSFVDKRYLGLTPAQYIVMGLFAVGVYLLVTAKNQPVAAVVAPSKKEEKKRSKR